jgi:D-glycero-D-manno-heptose 1,7-bisphosphate phosphatase
MGVDALKPAAVFLDRDGVLSRASVVDGRPYAPLHARDFEILPGSESALARLKAAGYALVVVTNQPEVARGRLTREAVEAMHARLAADLPVDEVRVCYHDEEDACDCRKPAPGLLLSPPTYAVDRSVMVGDRWRDIEAGRQAGCHATILIDYQYDESLPHEPDVRVASLDEAAEWILTNMGQA